MNSRNSRLRMISTRTAWSAGLTLALAAFGAFAGSADIADVPLASSSTASVKPNILFTLDDSGSMDWVYMPDEMGSFTSKLTFRSFVCNTVYYNPAITYIAPPQLADGTKLPNQSFTAAKSDGYNSASSTVNLSTSFSADDGGESGRAAYYWVLTGGTAPSPQSAACQGSAPSSTSTSPITSGGLTWTKVTVSATSGPGGTDERQNFANWYSYYRKRIMMMKAATARSFVTLSSSYRVGFITINPGATVSSSKYLRISDFDATQKQAFINKLYSQTANNSTPLREALSRAGWIYAGQLNTGLTAGIPAADDPVQYSCQQNFTLLTTDGYWNGNGGKDLANVDIGNTDASVGAVDAYGFNLPVSPRPMWDSAFDATTTTTTTTRTYFYSTSGCGGSKTRIRYNETVKQRVQGFSGGTLISDTTTNSSSTNNNFTNCQNNADPLPTPNPSTSTTTTTNNTPSGGSTNSLADVAEYYYKTDLRPSMTNNVPSIGTSVEEDRAPWQHMTTFTMGLGIFGTLNFDANYKTNTDPATDFNKIRAGSLNWPSTDGGSDPTKADDLWHTAVNGRGQAFNAKNPDEVVSGLNTALAGVNARVASAAAAATSNLEPVAGDNFAYTASYETVNWVGELQARQIDLSTGIVETTPIWSAQAKLDGQVNSFCDNRTIYLFRAGATNNLTPFAWNSDSCDASGNPAGTPQTTLNASEQANFATANVSLMSQFPSMTDGTAGTVNQKAAAAGANLVNFIRGQRGNEGFIANNIHGLYRTRTHILGDIVNAQPLFIRAPFASYTDAGYATTGGYKEQQASRTPMVYVAANDGMLHAFYAGSSTTDPLGGNERWAFMPTIVLPNLYVLADTNYANLHKFSVDGTPVAGDVYDSAATAWKTIIVAGLNKGGKGYYALDVTDPATPRFLWRITPSSTCYDAANSSTWSSDCNLGYSYGNPIISKLSDGTWVVFVTSGYNNVNGDTNDGKGYLYVLSAITGKIIKKIGTSIGDSTARSGGFTPPLAPLLLRACSSLARRWQWPSR